jgi:ArsR family transcriptional regulator, arsenate/arsenite/antimonite-responsive transcriptional repressor
VDTEPQQTTGVRAVKGEKPVAQASRRRHAPLLAYNRICGYTGDMRELADIFKALGDETRLQIMALLIRHGELCVCDIEHVLQATQSKTSRHLRYLANAGLVTARRDGLWAYYRLSDDTRVRRVRTLLKQLVTPEMLDEMQERLAAWCCAPGTNCSPVARAGARRLKTETARTT